MREKDNFFLSFSFKLEIISHFTFLIFTINKREVNLLTINDFCYKFLYSYIHERMVYVVTFRCEYGNWKFSSAHPVNTTRYNNRHQFRHKARGRCFHLQIITSENPAKFRVERRFGAESTIGAAARTTQKHFQQSVAIAHTSPTDDRQQATTPAAIERRAEEALEESHAA